MSDLPESARSDVFGPAHSGVGRSVRGSVMLEFVLAFPLVLTLILACMQLAHLWLAKEVVHYAAFCAARASLVCETSEYQGAGQRAAEQVCAWIAEGNTAGEQDKQIPGWGAIPGSGGVSRKTKATIASEGRWNIRATVSHDFALIFPLVGPMIGWGMNPWAKGQEYVEQQPVDSTGNIGDPDRVRYPHLRLTETVILPKPYATVSKMKIPVAGW